MRTWRRNDRQEERRVCTPERRDLMRRQEFTPQCLSHSCSSSSDRRSCSLSLLALIFTRGGMGTPEGVRWEMRRKVKRITFLRSHALLSGALLSAQGRNSGLSGVSEEMKGKKNLSEGIRASAGCLQGEKGEGKGTRRSSRASSEEFPQLYRVEKRWGRAYAHLGIRGQSLKIVLSGGGTTGRQANAKRTKRSARQGHRTLDNHIHKCA